MSPGRAARRHLAELLDGIAAGGYHNEVAKSGATFPHIVGTELGPQAQINGMGEPGAHEFMKRVRAVALGESSPADAAEAIYEALSQANTQQGEYEVSSIFMRAYESAIENDGRQFRQEGGDYLVLVRAIRTFFAVLKGDTYPLALGTYAWPSSVFTDGVAIDRDAYFGGNAFAYYTGDTGSAKIQVEGIDQYGDAETWTVSAAALPASPPGVWVGYQLTPSREGSYITDVTSISRTGTPAEDITFYIESRIP
jgi:hypothetical protein